MRAHTVLPTGGFSSTAAIVSILSILLNVRHAGDYPLWSVSRFTYGRVATAALSTVSPRRVGPDSVAVLGRLPRKARAPTQEVL